MSLEDLGLFVCFHNAISVITISGPLPLKLPDLFPRDPRAAGFGAGRAPWYLPACGFLLSGDEALLPGIHPLSPTEQTPKTHTQQFPVEASPLPA